MSAVTLFVILLIIKILYFVLLLQAPDVSELSLKGRCFSLLFSPLNEKVAMSTFFFSCGGKAANFYFSQVCVFSFSFAAAFRRVGPLLAHCLEMWKKLIDVLWIYIYPCWKTCQVNLCFPLTTFDFFFFTGLLIEMISINEIFKWMVSISISLKNRRITLIVSSLTGSSQGCFKTTHSFECTILEWLEVSFHTWITGP